MPTHRARGHEKGDPKVALAWIAVCVWGQPPLNSRAMVSHHEPVPADWATGSVS